MTYGTLFVGLYGKWTLQQPWKDPDTAKSDAYSLFFARALAMGWLEDLNNGFWGMNDAGIHVSDEQPDATSEQAYTAWFQVGVSGSMPPDRPLPVQPFLSCVDAVVGKMGQLQVETIQLLLPMQVLSQSADMPAFRSLLQAAGWFADQLPQNRVRVRLTLDGGQNPAIRTVAPDLFSKMQTIRQDVINWESFSLSEEKGATPLQPLLIDGLWNGPAEQRVTLQGTLAEWSLDAVGWAAAFLTSVCARYSVDTPLVLTVEPA